ncbi:MAG: hypothetical protein ACYTGC_04835, partial [Planctomycetota bacterium]
MGTGADSQLIPGAFSPRFVAFFARYVRRFAGRRFNAIRLERRVRPLLGELREVAEPVIILLNHSSWWDPLLALLVGHELMAGRSGCAP